MSSEERIFKINECFLTTHFIANITLTTEQVSLNIYKKSNITGKEKDRFSLEQIGDS